MSQRVYRFEVPIDDLAHDLRLFGNPLGVACRNPEAVEFWAVHDDNSKVELAPRRSFIVVGTGHALPANWWRHWGHAISGPIVWHLIELSTHDQRSAVLP